MTYYDKKRRLNRVRDYLLIRLAYCVSRLMKDDDKLSGELLFSQMIKLEVRRKELDDEECVDREMLEEDGAV